MVAGKGSGSHVTPLFLFCQFIAGWGRGRAGRRGALRNIVKYMSWIKIVNGMSLIKTDLTNEYQNQWR